MTNSDSPALRPLASLDAAPLFREAWQAEALAIADTLIGNGMFSADAWTDALGKALTEAALAGESDTQDTYYRCVLIALERLVAANSAIDRQAMIGKRTQWEKAYLSTPHGQPVHLETPG